MDNNAQSIVLYVTSDEAAQKTREVPIRPLKERMYDAYSYLFEGFGLMGSVEARILSDPEFIDQGATDTDVTVVSTESLASLLKRENG